MCVAAFLAASALPGSPQSDWTLARAIERAQTDNPRAHEALARVRQARASLAQVMGTFWPRLNVAARYSMTNLPAASFGNLVNHKSIESQRFTGFGDFDNLPTTDNFSVSGGISIPIYAGGIRFARRRASEHRIDALDHQAQAIRAILGLETARTYFRIAREESLRQAAEAAVNAFEKNLEVARNRYQNGQMLEQEMLAVKVRLAEAQEAVLVAKNSAALGRQALAALLVVDSARTDASTPVELAIPSNTQAGKRPELLACRQGTDRADAMIDVARGSYRPAVGAFGRIVYNKGILEESGDSFGFVAGIGVELSFGLDTPAKVEAAKHARAQVGHQCEQLALALRLQAQQARTRLKEADGRLAITANEIALADKSAAVVRARFEEGLALSTQLIEAETALTSARVRRAEAETARYTAIAELRYAVGLPIASARGSE